MLPPMPVGQQDATAVCIDSNRILLIGGDSKDAQLLTRSTDGQWSWRVLAEMTAKHRTPGAVLLPGGDRVLVAGGFSQVAEVLELPKDDTDPGKWTQVPGFNFRVMESWLVNFNGRVLFFRELNMIS